MTAVVPQSFGLTKMREMTLPEGWTDDRNVTIRKDRTIPELTIAVMKVLDEFEGESAIVCAIAEDFGMTESDAWLAFDRVQGGIIRALTTQPGNCPDRAKDPLAWHAFHLTWETLPPLHWCRNEGSLAALGQLGMTPVGRSEIEQPEVRFMNTVVT
ncbi:hypothetical protein DYQ86_12010 [Acidobacteria bacterium AB60]|nr:hypothetical protein DYQ86_12010 [Acidobacteria bacterium AB60]